MFYTRHGLFILPLLLVVGLVGALLFMPAASHVPLPISGRIASNPGGEAYNRQPSLEEFAASLKTGSPELAGVYVPHVMAFEVVQQPTAEAGYVSTQANVVTQFQLAMQFNTTGLLAHDYLAGATFNRLKPGQVAALVYGNGVIKYFEITSLRKFQALDPESTSSRFVDLTTQRTISAEEVFYLTYGVGNALVFQTCISTSQVSSWGRLFVMARPISAPAPRLGQVAPILVDILKNAGLVLSRP